MRVKTILISNIRPNLLQLRDIMRYLPTEASIIGFGRSTGIFTANEYYITIYSPSFEDHYLIPMIRLYELKTGRYKIV